MDAQGTQTNAKEDTRGLWLNYELDADLSQWETDLTLSVAGPNYGNNGAYRASDTPRQLTGAGGREIVVRFEVNPGTDKKRTVVALGPPASSATVAWTIELNSGTGALDFRQGGTVLGSIAFVAISGQQEVTVSWSTRPNPETTGASDALISECQAFGHDSSEFEEPIQFIHAAASVAGTDAFMLGGYGGAGGNAWTRDVRQIRSCRIGCAWHPAAEWCEDWIFTRTAPPAGLPMPSRLVPVTWASALGQEGQWIGQANAGVIAAESTARARAGWTPLINEVYTDAQPIAVESVELAPAGWHRSAPGSSVFRLRIDFLRWVPVPRGCAHAWVRVHMTQWTDDKGASDPCPMQVCCWAMNRPFAVGPVGGETFRYSRTQQSLLLEYEDFVTGIGRWIDLGLVQLPTYAGPEQGWRDTVFLALGWAFDPESAYAGDVEVARMRIDAWHARPVYKAIAGLKGDP